MAGLKVICFVLAAAMMMLEIQAWVLPGLGRLPSDFQWPALPKDVEEIEMQARRYE